MVNGKDINMKDNGEMIKKKEMVYIIMQVVKSMKGNGEMVKLKEMGYVIM